MKCIVNENLSFLLNNMKSQFSSFVLGWHGKYAAICLCHRCCHVSCLSHLLSGLFRTVTAVYRCHCHGLDWLRRQVKGAADMACCGVCGPYSAAYSCDSEDAILGHLQVFCAGPELLQKFIASLFRSELLRSVGRW